MYQDNAPQAMQNSLQQEQSNFSANQDYQMKQIYANIQKSMIDEKKLQKQIQKQQEKEHDRLTINQINQQNEYDYQRKRNNIANQRKELYNAYEDALKIKQQQKIQQKEEVKQFQPDIFSTEGEYRRQKCQEYYNQFSQTQEKASRFSSANQANNQKEINLNNLINKRIEEENSKQQKIQEIQMLQKYQNKLSYKQQLESQIAEKGGSPYRSQNQNLQQMPKQQIYSQQQNYQRSATQPLYEEKQQNFSNKLLQQQIYKDYLDTQVSEKKRNQIFHNSGKQSNYAIDKPLHQQNMEQFQYHSEIIDHHPLLNPMPNNIQNPYIQRINNENNIQSSKNINYFANLANQQIMSQKNSRINYN